MHRNRVVSIGTQKHGIRHQDMLNTRVDKTSCIGLDFGFKRLIRRGDNPNKKTLIYILYTPCHHNLSSYNLSCLNVTEQERQE